ncbi:ecto-ADP-ribosyltransferase 4-like [Cheilinus undulatus]|uniref:ecto-ADP-ribosyltransferase 4-like n=1 Tax=Cheilinus undulatus TaxID=241271 RepID=UPI001BD33A45|nr:ecto-ADP-ribosyltransferase 4-like [Cheilinus undulatus]XP_041641980.1 ecto-ADP-ribosyltransferase 4-like [Cheilinus undulatus]
MPSRKTKTAHQRKCLTAFVFISLLMVGLLIAIIIFVKINRQDVAEEGPLQPQTHNLNCSSRVAAIPGEAAFMQTWNSGSFQQAWSDAEKKAKTPAHLSMTKNLSTAIYMYTSGVLQADKQDGGNTEHRRGQQRGTIESLLYFSLNEAVEILKYRQKTACLNTSYRTEEYLNPDISNKLVHFSTFTVGSDWRKSTKNTYCFELNTCFSVNITHYSALEGFDQALIPPYEMFKITDIKTNTQGCKVLYKLESMKCVYDGQLDEVHELRSSADPYMIIIVGMMAVLVVLVVVEVVLAVKICKQKDLCRTS